MSLTEPRLTDIVKKQLRYKLNAYTGIFSSLLVMQLIGIFMGFNAGGGGGSRNGNTLTFAYSLASGDMPVIFTLIWAFSMGILVTTIAYRNDAFSFVSNRLSHHLSNFLLLLVASSIAGITAALAGSIIKFISLFSKDLLFSETIGLTASPFDFLIQIATLIVYMILFTGLGYLIGSFIQLSKLVIPILIVGLFILPMFGLNVYGSGIIEKMVVFFGTETSFPIFLVKVIATVLVLFIISILCTNKLEVRK